MSARRHTLAASAMALGLMLSAAGCATPADGGGPADRRWTLVELNGQPVGETQREPFIVLSQGRMTGSGGCNSLGGGYTIDETTARIDFGPIVSTRMACATGMDIEQALSEALDRTDNYSLSGDTLTLNRARMAPLARFRASGDAPPPP